MKINLEVLNSMNDIVSDLLISENPHGPAPTYKEQLFLLARLCTALTLYYKGQIQADNATTLDLKYFSISYTE